MTMIEIRIEPNEGDRFASTAFDQQIGKYLPTGAARCKLLSAAIADDGRSAILQVAPDDRLSVALVADHLACLSLNFAEGEGFSAVPIPAQESAPRS